jgi:ETC complex I subunit conserved region
MPADYTYRKTTEALVLERTNIIKHAANIGEAETKIGAGQIEEVIIQVSSGI